jgi:hypothetical protein
MSGNRERAAQFVRQVWWAGAVKVGTGPAADDLTAMLDAERVRGRAEVAAKVREVHVNDEGDGIVQNFCVHDGREWPCPTIRALADEADREARPDNAHPDMAGNCAHGVPMAGHCRDCEAGR